MGRPVIGAAIGLDLHDPADAAAGRVITDQPRPEQGAGRVLDRTGQPGAVRLAQEPGKSAVMVSGTRNPKTAKKAGMRTSWK